MPHLFSVGGLFYEQVKRDLGLTDAKHCRLPVLPNKVGVVMATVFVLRNILFNRSKNQNDSKIILKQFFFNELIMIRDTVTPR